MPNVARSLLDWFKREQRRLPWRGPFPREPYLVLVSEVMLQQTRVERVIPAYLRFTERFPTVEELAAAPIDDVLQAFSGLGYYGRARQLHAAAGEVVARGEWPRTRSELQALPGIGPYTGAALAAFAFDGQEPPVDGNVERVVARLKALPLRASSTKLRRAAEEQASALHSAAPSPALWEALMELGARLCTPGQPHCSACPLAPACAARRSGTAAELPLPRRKRSSEDHRWVALWLEADDGRVLLRRVPPGDLLEDLWLPPFAELGPGEDEVSTAAALATSCGGAGTVRRVGEVRHSITHRRIRVTAFCSGTRRAAVGERSPDWVWADPYDPPVATSTLTAKLARVAGVSVDPPSTPVSEDGG